MAFSTFVRSLWSYFNSLTALTSPKTNKFSNFCRKCNILSPHTRPSCTMCAQRWYPEGYVLPTSSAHPPGPYHPAYTQRTIHSSGPKPWYTPKPQTPPSNLRDNSGARRSSSSSQTRSSSSSSYTHLDEMARMAGVGDPGLITGVDYFKVSSGPILVTLLLTRKVLDWRDRSY